MESKCVACGDIIPKGRMICLRCEEIQRSGFQNLDRDLQNAWERELKRQIDELTTLKDSDADQEVKADAGKPKLSLVPKQIVYEIEKVRSFAQKKYKDANSWKRVDIERYHEALLRHTMAVWDDITKRDEESGLLHLAHIATNAAFLLEMLKDKE